MASINFHIIGTIHNDFTAPTKLSELIEEINPDIILSEGLDEHDNNHKTNWEFIEMLPKIKSKFLDLNEYQIIFIEKLLKKIDSVFGYEHMSAKNYSKINNIPLEYIDKPCISDNFINNDLPDYHIDMIIFILNKMDSFLKISSDNNELELETLYNEFIETQKSILKLTRFFRNISSIECSELYNSFNIDEREEYFYNKIINIFNSNLYSNILFICGNYHVDRIALKLDDKLYTVKKHYMLYL